MVRASALQSSGCWFDSRSDHYQVTTLGKLFTQQQLSTICQVAAIPICLPICRRDVLVTNSTEKSSP